MLHCLSTPVRVHQVISLTVTIAVSYPPINISLILLQGHMYSSYEYWLQLQISPNYKL